MRRSPTAATPITVLTPIQPGQDAELAAYLARLPRGQASPFSRLSSTHFVRFVILGPLPTDYPGAPNPPRPLRMQYLLFSSTSNSPARQYLEELRLVLGPEADRVWGHCVNYPGHHRASEFHRYFRRNSLRTHLWFGAYEATVTAVRTALQLRERHITFALAHGLDDDEDLQRAFIEHFQEE